MRNHEFFATGLAAEIPAFLRVLRAIPGDRLDYKPHEKNTAAGELAWQIAREVSSLTGLLENGVIDYRPELRPDSVDDIASEFERGARAVVERARSVSDDRWKGPAKFLYAGNVAWEATAAEMAWGFLFDLIHHRGQLSVYLRPMGAKVPSIYGPSADDPGA